MERRSRVHRISLDKLFLRSGLTIYSAGASQSERHADFMKLAVHFSGGLSSNHNAWILNNCTHTQGPT